MKIRNKRGVWIFAIVTSLVSIGLAELLVLVTFPEAMYDFVAPRAAVIAGSTTIPICLFVGSKIRENTVLGMELVRLVNRDRLTDVATRDFFFRKMDMDPETYGVSLMVDIDHFKRVNDQFGHLMGDAVIKHVSEILEDQCRDGDIVCRFGGEEFVIFLREATGESGINIAERIRAAVENASTVADGVDVSVTVSIGGSMKERYEDVVESIREADEALYKAKEGGRNRTVVHWLPEPANRIQRAG